MFFHIVPFSLLKSQSHFPMTITVRNYRKEDLGLLGNNKYVSVLQIVVIVDIYMPSPGFVYVLVEYEITVSSAANFLH